MAVAIRNRWRRKQLPEEMRQEVSPKNILMIGPTGVGKTEIARRLAKLTGAPFIKVEATKYTEVGYYGRDVESMVRELVENAIGLVRERERTNVQDEAQQSRRRAAARPADAAPGQLTTMPIRTDAERYERNRVKMRTMLIAGELDERTVELTVEQKATPVVFSGMGMEQMDVDLQGMFEKIMPRQSDDAGNDRGPGPRGPVRTGMRGAAGSRKDQRRGDRTGREPGHHLPGRNRQGRRQRVEGGRRVATGRAA